MGAFEVLLKVSLIGVSLELLSACASHRAIRCDVDLKPINAPAPKGSQPTSQSNPKESSLRVPSGVRGGEGESGKVAGENAQ